MAILFNDMWHSAVVDFGCVSSRILWIKLKLSRVRDFLVVGYDPLRKMVKKGTDSGTTWTGLWIA